MVALLCVVFGLRVAAPPRLPALTSATFHEAWNRWDEHAPAGYDIEVAVSGPQAATYRVQVRAGEVISATRNGFALKGYRTIGTWSVPGMFHTMEIDLDQLGRSEETATTNSQRLILSCQFDTALGYPAHYRRIEMGSRMQVEWQVTSLTIED